jgi:hypothetical protein
MKPARAECLVVIFIAIVIAYQIFVPPLIGLADSGDFNRFLGQTGLAHSKTTYEDKYFDFFDSRYSVIAKSSLPGQYSSSSLLLIRAARWLSIRLGGRESFDIRVLAAVRLLPFLLGLWLILVASRPLSPVPRSVLAGLLALMFTDAGYIAYFNSFYSEPTALLFLALAFGMGLVLISGRSSNFLFLVGYFAAIAFVLTSKPQHAPIAPIFCLFGVVMAKHTNYARRYRTAIVLALVVCGITAWYYRRTPFQLRSEVAYLGLFMDLLPNSSTPREDLAALGLNPDYERFTGTNPYEQDSPFWLPEIQSDLTKKITSYRLPLFYVTHPARFFDLSKRCIRHAFTLRIARLGYYEAESGKLPRTQGFGLWSIIRENIFPRSVLFLALFITSAIPAAAIALKSKAGSLKTLSLLYVALVGVAAAQFLVAILSQGEMDLAKHLFMFNLAFDACLILLTLGFVYFVQLKIAPSEGSRQFSV